MNLKSIFIVDPINYRGGSKVATEYILSSLGCENHRVVVLTRDKSSWNLPGVLTHRYWEPGFLAQASVGKKYFLRHILICIQALFCIVLNGRPSMLLGASGPGIDLSLYLLKLIIGIPVTQLIHGPISNSRTIARCLRYADKIFCLTGNKGNVIKVVENGALDKKQLAATVARISEFENGMPKESWPTPTHEHGIKILWAASLLKWKGLDILVEALNKFDDQARPSTNICYLRPKNSSLQVSDSNISIQNVAWHEAPDDLDHIRASSTVFVSTSTQEPFGLSILEAMAAGLTVVLPSDGAYWDRVLVDYENCIKYKPCSPNDLLDKIKFLVENDSLARSIALSGRDFSSRYSANNCYAEIVSHLSCSDSLLSASKPASDRYPAG